MSATQDGAPLRVLMITARADFGGGPEHVFQLSRALAPQAEVFIACPREEPYWERYAGLVTSARMLELPHRSFRWADLSRLMGWLRRERIDLVHAHGFGGGIYGRLAAACTGKVCAYTSHGVTPASDLRGRIKALVDLVLSVVTTRIIAVSPSEREALRSRCVFTAAIQVIANGVAIPLAHVGEGTLTLRPHRVIHVTRFVYQKNFELVLEILQALRSLGRLPDFRLIILGEGPERLHYESMVKDAGFTSAVEFRGAVPDVPGQCLEAVGMLSTSRWEGMPLALLEGMSAGLPIVATAVVGNRDAVQHGVSGFLFDPADPAAAAQHLVALVDSPPRWRQVSAAARERVTKGFSTATMAATTLLMYRQTLLQARRGRPAGALSRHFCGRVQLLAVCLALLLGRGSAVATQLPDGTVPSGIGVNVFILRTAERDLDAVAAAGFRFIRRDFAWADTEKAPGEYDFSGYDVLTDAAEKRGMHLLYILDYSHPLYEKDGAAPQHPESIAAFARWAAAAASRYRGRHVVWEIWNEPNNPFWKPKPDPQQYAALALATCKAMRAADPAATIVGPASGYFPHEFLEVLFKNGLLSYLDAVSVHPYPPGNPEPVAAEYAKLHDLIDRYAPRGRTIPIVSSEWGYSTFTGWGGVAPDVQAQYLVRQQLWNIACGIPLSIWFCWNDVGARPTEREDNYGIVSHDLAPKPAYTALQAMVRELSGFKFVRRVEAGTKKDFILLFKNTQNLQKLAVWTSGDPHKLRLPGSTSDLSVTGSPQYLIPRGISL